MRALKAREIRLLVLFAVFVAIVVWDYARRSWSPDTILESEHYATYSTATDAQTDEIGRVAEIVYAGYVQLLGQLGQEIRPHPRLKIKLFKDRREFRHCNRVRGWAEAFYRAPYCYQYYSADEINPYHWMMHEATHQLNAEAVGLSLPQWLDEGIACYVSTSRIINNTLCLGQIDSNTYPVWWLDEMAVSGDLETDKGNATIIPLRDIISGRGGPDIDEHFNLYYLHWWSLTHFLMQHQDGRYQAPLRRLIVDGGGLPAFEKEIAEVERLERQWYRYVLDLKQRLAGRGTPPVTLERRNARESF